MDKKRSAKNAHSARKRHDLSPHSTNYYLNFEKARKKLGNVATRGFFQVRDFLAREIQIPSVSSVTEPISNLASYPFGKPSEHENKQEKEEKDNETSKRKELDNIVKNSNEILAEATTVFPFTLFPDTITVDRTKLTITRRTFFMTSSVLTIHIEDILNLSANVGPLFGSLRIAIKGLTSEDHFHMNYFWRKDAIHLKHIIQGHMMAQHEKIDYRHLEHKKLIKTLLELGQDSNPEK